MAETHKPKYRNLSSLNLNYMENLYEQFRRQDNSLSKDWISFFEGMEFASVQPKVSPKSFKVSELITAYRMEGHLKAQLDPLGFQKPKDELFKLSHFDLSEKDLKKTFDMSEPLKGTSWTLEKIITHMENTYCKTLTVNLGGCSPEIKSWFYEKLERSSFEISEDQKREILEQIVNTEALEKFIHTRYVGAKRFSIEGGDALIPMTEELFTQAINHKLSEVVIGMAHRGRTNILVNFMNKGLDAILASFENHSLHGPDFEGDVKYHLGYSTDKISPKGECCHISLIFNPSHLEFVNPVVLGNTRAKQRLQNDMAERKAIIPLLIHGDAAFSGQGIVTESLQLSELDGYTVGGAIHLIINNQLGFTTEPGEGRSTLYSSDTSKVIGAPVILINGDDVESCVKAMNLAFHFRKKFKKDVVIEMYCYRRFGHNEGDEPTFTQPQMYKTIKKHPTLKFIYGQKLITENIVNQDWIDSLYKKKIDSLQKVLDKVKSSPPEPTMDTLKGRWDNLIRAKKEDFETVASTQTSFENLKKVCEALFKTPENFQIHPKLKKLLEKRKQMFEEKKIDWGLAELLAYGTLCLEGFLLRLSGQDSKRGTFSHRHASYFDYEKREEYIPLSHIDPKQAEFNVYNSPLSEAAVLGFEYGNSLSDPNYLVLWEAQFGDFVNGAQVIIDQFIASGELKWGRMSGMVLLLPHGYEGQGPEHTSARIERFLQLCGQYNIQVCNVTTPANFFHVIRRQVHRPFRKPLIIATPKSLLRHPQVISPLHDFISENFKEVLEDPHVKDLKKIETLILCSGKIYYEIQAKREKKAFQDKKTVIRIEQLYPFPKTALTPFLNGCPKLKKVLWIQEEPQNMGAYFFIKPLLEHLMEELGLKRLHLEFISRPVKASPATGSIQIHKQEQALLIQQALEI